MGEFEQGRDTSELNYKELQEKGVFDLPYKAFQFMQSQQSKIEQLEKEKTALHNAFVYMDDCRKEWHEGYMRLHKQKTEITRLVQGLRNEFDLCSDDGEGFDAIEAQIELLEKTLRGAS